MVDQPDCLNTIVCSVWANRMLCKTHLFSFVLKFRIMLPRDMGNKSDVPKISSISWHQNVLYLLGQVSKK